MSIGSIRTNGSSRPLKGVLIAQVAGFRHVEQEMGIGPVGFDGLPADFHDFGDQVPITGMKVGQLAQQVGQRSLRAYILPGHVQYLPVVNQSGFVRGQQKVV